MVRRQASRADPLTPDQRRLNMSRIRSADTKPEMLVRRGLHERGLRFRLHDRRLPGKPDLVFASARVAVFVHGCFWHGHDCALGVRPRSNPVFWDTKIGRTQARDAAVHHDLLEAGWRVATVWECALRGRGRLADAAVLDSLVRFIRSSGEHVLVLRGDTMASRDGPS